MAGIYKIGSQKGYEIANGLRVGQSTTVGDGSVWTKNPDGSISVFHQGQQMIGQITYQPATQQPGIQQPVTQQPASRPSSSGATGIYNIGSQKGYEIANGLSAGQSTTVGDGSVWTKNADGSISVFHQGQNKIGNVTYQPMVQQTPSANAGQTVSGVYKIGSEDGYNIANSLQPGQSISVGDGSVWTKNADGTITVQHNGKTLMGQILYNPVSQQQNPGQNYIQQNTTTMPGSAGYKSPYAEEIEKVIASLQDTKWEGWDPDTDPSMQAYRKQYLREADRTMEDVLGQYAQNTGGIAGSQAIAAASQASDYYKSQLADKVPELYQNAYSQYLNEVAQKQNLASVLLSAENQASSQYYQRISYALSKWGQMGYADQEVAKILGVAAGTPTSDQSYSDWSTAFQTNQYQDAQQAAQQKTSVTPSYVPYEEPYEEPQGEPVEEFTTEEFNQFWRTLKENITAGQLERAKKQLEKDIARLTDEQAAKLEQQIAKLPAERAIEFKSLFQ